MTDKNSVGSILRKLRREKRNKRIEAAQWTQEAVARRIGVSRVTYIAWEKDEWRPDTDHLIRIIEVFRPNEMDEAALYRAVAQPPPEIFDLPFLRSSYFTGRETYLTQLRQLLQENGIVCLTGLAGVGKTQIALEYAYSSHPDVYRTVLWVNAADRTMLETEYASLAQTLGLPEKDDQELKQRIRAVKIWLQTHTNWLLIMDNADELPIVRPFLLPKPLGHIVLTTRWQFTDKIAKPLAIEAMGSEEGLLFLWRRTRTEQDEVKDNNVPQDIREPGLQLVEGLGGHALALEQAGAYIQDTLVSFMDYLMLYREYRRSLLDQHGALDDERVTVAATFKTSSARARELAPMAEDILHFCAFLQPDAIPEELFRHDESFKSNAMAFNKGIAALLRYSLIKRNRQFNTLSMHRLVQAVHIDDMSPPDLQMQWRERVVRTVSAAFSEVDFNYWGLPERFLPHAFNCATWTEDELTPSVEVAKLYHKLDMYLMHKINLLEADDFKAQVLSIYVKHLGVEHPLTAAALHDLAMLITCPDLKFEEAASLMVRAISIQEKHLSTAHPDTLISLHNLVCLCLIEYIPGQLERAMGTMLSMLDRYLSTAHPDTLISLPWLSSRDFDQYNYDTPSPLFIEMPDAEADMPRPLLVASTPSMLDRYLSTAHPDTLISLPWLSPQDFDQYNYEPAVLLYLRTFKLWGKLPRVENPDIALLLLRLVVSLHEDRKHEQAHALYQRVLSITEQRLDATHPFIQALKRDYADYLHGLSLYEQVVADDLARMKGTAICQNVWPLCAKRLAAKLPFVKMIRSRTGLLMIVSQEHS